MMSFYFKECRKNIIKDNLDINHKFKISNTTYYQYNFQNSKHRIYSIAEIGIGITKNITYKMGFTLQYDNDPIFHAPTLVYSTSNKLSFTF